MTAAICILAAAIYMVAAIRIGSAIGRGINRADRQP